MTCIVGYIEGDTVHIGGDSAGVDDDFHITIRKDQKVFTQGPFIMGFTSSFRMGQLLMSSKFKPPKQKAGQSDYDYMITEFIDVVRARFNDGGYLQKDDGADKGGFFLVGYKGVLYEIHEDFQVGIPYDNFSAVGCGDNLAKGALFALKSYNIPVRKKLETALESANHFSAGVSPPYSFVSMKKSESVEKSKKIK